MVPGEVICGNEFGRAGRAEDGGVYVQEAEMKSGTCAGTSVTAVATRVEEVESL